MRKIILVLATAVILAFIIILGKYVFKFEGLEMIKYLICTLLFKLIYNDLKKEI